MAQGQQLAEHLPRGAVTVATPHNHVPRESDPNQCGACFAPWNSIQHQPSLWAGEAPVAHERARELPEDLQAVAPYERPSGAPFRPATIATRLIMCPFSAIEPNTRQCDFIAALDREAVRTHLMSAHNWPPFVADDYLSDPWFSNEPRSKWKDRTFHKRYGMRGADIGRVRSEQDAYDKALKDGVPPTEVWAKLLEDVEQEVKSGRATQVQDSVVLKPVEAPAVRCPVTIDCAYSTIPVSEIRQHLAGHGWDRTRVDDWMEQVGVTDSSLIPAVVEEAMAERERARQEMEAFMDPKVTTEELAGLLSPEMAEKFEAMTPSQLEALLTEWWMDKAEEEVRRTVPKAVEYGALDLIQIGQDLALTAGREVTDEEAAELGVYFYVRGKLARWTDAIVRGDRVSDDTLFDLGVYIRMAQRIRDAGGWPGLPKD